MDPSAPPAMDQGAFLLHRNKGREHYEAQEFSAARGHLELAVRLRPDDPEPLSWLAMTYFRLDQHPEAEAAFRRLVALRPGVATLHVNLGIVLYKRDRQEAAEVEFRRALELPGSGNRPHLYLGLIHSRRGELATALRHLEAAGAEVMAARLRSRISGITAAGQPTTAAPAEPGPDAAGTPAPPPREERAPGLGPLDGPAAVAESPEAPGSAAGTLEIAGRGRLLATVDFAGTLLVRRGALAGFSGHLRFESAPEEADLLRARGEGRVLLAGDRRRLVTVGLDGQRLVVEIGHFVACDAAVARELVSLGRRDGTGLRALALEGTGSVVLACGGRPVEIRVELQSPVSVSAELLVGWWGELKPTLVRQGSLEDRALRGGEGALKLHLQGTGRVLMDHQREAGL